MNPPSVALIPQETPKETSKKLPRNFQESRKRLLLGIVSEWRRVGKRAGRRRVAESGVLALLSTAAMRELDGWYSWVGTEKAPKKH
jgi:hypothetical protein